jgi:hypothetical protein
LANANRGTEQRHLKDQLAGVRTAEPVGVGARDRAKAPVEVPEKGAEKDDNGTGFSSKDFVSANPDIAGGGKPASGHTGQTKNIERR